MPLSQMTDISRHGEDRLVPVQNPNLFEELLLVSEEENDSESSASSTSSTNIPGGPKEGL